jgi:hypothetical protein
MADHMLTVTNETDEDGHITQILKMTCTAPVGARCRMHCPVGCFEWSFNHNHKLIDYGKCLAVEGLDAVDYVGYEDKVYESGPVNVYWSDESWEFEPITDKVANED